jgi:hypothetical protein
VIGYDDDDGDDLKNGSSGDASPESNGVVFIVK